MEFLVPLSFISSELLINHLLYFFNGRYCTYTKCWLFLGQLDNLYCSVFISSQSVLPWLDCSINSNRTGSVEECERASPTQYFFYRETLDISSSIEENGGIHTGQALCLMLAWVITYLFIVQGVKSTGKVRDPQAPQFTYTECIYIDRYHFIAHGQGWCASCKWWLFLTH